jgi:transcriptional regulator with XRE-family HTH domain
MRDYSQKDLANIMGVPRTYISKIELGRSIPKLSSLEKLAKGLNVPLQFFLFHYNNPPLTTQEGLFLAFIAGFRLLSPENRLKAIRYVKKNCNHNRGS